MSVSLCHRKPNLSRLAPMLNALPQAKPVADHSLNGTELSGAQRRCGPRESSPQAAEVSHRLLTTFKAKHVSSFTDDGLTRRERYIIGPG